MPYQTYKCRIVVLAWCLCLVAAAGAGQGVVINEYMASNSGTIADEDGDYSDWIEIYNASGLSADLGGWGLSDDPERPFRWVFPHVIIEPGGHLLVWASGKDRKPVDVEPLAPNAVDGLVGWFEADSLSGDGQPIEVWPDGSGRGNHTVQNDPLRRPVLSVGAVNGRNAVLFNKSQGQFFNLPTQQFNGLDSFENFTVISIARWNGITISGLFGTNGYSLNSGNIHFEIGSGGELRLRVANMNDIRAAKAVAANTWTLIAAEQQSRGEEFMSRLLADGRVVAVAQADPGAVDTADYHNIYLGSSYSGRTFGGLIAETIIFDRVLSESERRGIELYLRSKYGLSGYEGAPILHTNFSIAAAGEPILLTRPDGTLADSAGPKALPEDMSYGRVTDGAPQWVFFAGGTPGTSNDSVMGYTSILERPQFSAEGGFYAEAFELTLGSEDPEATIYYTLDGSEPTTASRVYTGPLEVRVRHDDENLIANIETTPEFDPSRVDKDHVAQQLLEAITWMPPGLVKKATVVRAMAAKEGALSSASVTRTFWADPEIYTRFALPVISLNTDASNLFDPDYGIYVRGNRFVNSNPGRPWHSRPANYRERGTAWERPVHVAFYGADGGLWMEQNAGVRIHGGATRALAQKTMRLYARDDYEASSFKYPVFEDQPFTSYKRLLLRNSGNDWNLTLFRDALSQGVSRHMLADTQAYRPAVVYLNGEYWGIHNIRERPDKHYIARKYGVDSENLDLRDGSSMDEGDSVHYNALSSYINNNDMTNPVHFAEVERRMDTDQFIDYFIAQIFARNTDWPGNNIACWRLRVPFSPDAPYGHDGRWRWLLFDVEHGFGYRDPFPDWAFNMMPQARNHSFFNRLLANAGFRRRFINRFVDQLNSAYLPSRILPMIEEMKERIAPEMPHHIERWLRPGSLAGWDQNIEPMRAFATHRADAARGHLRSHFGLGVDRRLTLNVSEIEGGFVRVNRTEINGNTPGVDAVRPYPWSGLYFDGIPITITAVPLQGFAFSHWSGAEGIDPHAGTLTLTPTSDVSLTAHFEPLILVHYWHFNALEGEAVSSVEADYSLRSGAEIAYPGSGDGYMDSTDGSVLNARMGRDAGQCLRVRNPSDKRELLLTLPTTGFEAIRLSYAARRTSQGAQSQRIEYRTTVGGGWQHVGSVTVAQDYEVYTFDFADVAGVSDNPEFAVRILFGGSNASGLSGNNRFDNITLEGLPLPGTNLPPEQVQPLPFTEAIEQKPVMIDLSPYFADREGDFLTFAAESSKPFVVEAEVSGNVLTLTPLYRGDAVIKVAADDGHNPPTEASFRVLVYPAAQVLRLGMFRFDEWSPEHPEHAFPEGMLFVQGDAADPGEDAALEYAYYIPHEGEDGYHGDDEAVIGFPYMATRRSRINGLGEDGLSFINTGRQRDLGGALAAFDTTGMDEVRVSWLGGTIVQNAREYAIRLQYRIGHTGPFADVADDGKPVEYLVKQDGDTELVGPVELPASALDQPYVQLLWRYCHVSGDSGARPQLRLDDIMVRGGPDPVDQLMLLAQWWLMNDCAVHDHCGGADLTQDGRVDLEDFARLAVQWLSTGSH